MLESDLENLKLALDKLLFFIDQKKLETIALKKKLNALSIENALLITRKKMALEFVETLIKQLEDELYLHKS